MKLFLLVVVIWALMVFVFLDYIDTKKDKIIITLGGCEYIADDNGILHLYKDTCKNPIQKGD